MENINDEEVVFIDQDTLTDEEIKEGGEEDEQV